MDQNPALFEHAPAERTARRSRPSLDPQETNPHQDAASFVSGQEARQYTDVTPPGYCGTFERPTPTHRETSFRHAGWAAAREKVKQSMERTNQPARRREAFNCCGGGAWVYVTRDGKAAQVRACYCKDRMCKACGAARAKRIHAALTEPMKAATCKLVTLTLRQNALTLADQLTRLYQCFANLRRHKLWKQHVRGGAAFCEIKRNFKTRGWHVHLHLIVDGDYFAQRLLSAAWLVATGDSPIVDIRAIKDPATAGRYVAKYVTKPADSEITNDPDSLDEMLVSLKGRRLCMTFGSWRGIELEPETPPDEREWKMIGRLDHVQQQAERGDPHSTAVMLLLRRKDLLNDPSHAPPRPRDPLPNRDNG